MFETLEKELQKHGITAPIEPNSLKPTRGGSTWLIIKTWDNGGKQHAAATFGDFKTGQKFDWKSPESEATPVDRTQTKGKLAELIEAQNQAAKEEQERLAPLLESEFHGFNKASDHPYFRKKGIRPPAALRLKPNDHGDPILAVPLFDEKGKFWNFQRIYAQKLSKGDKFFAESARIEGCFFAFTSEGKLPDTPPEVLYLCEGVATAASVHESLPGSLVLSAFNAQNLHPVAVAVKRHWPQVKIIICADDDKYTVIRGKPTNVGLEKGRRAGGAVGGEIRFPTFKYPREGLTDFNDLAAAEGLDMVRDQLENPSKYVKGIQPMLLKEGRFGKPEIPSEVDLANYLLRYFDGRLVKQDRDIFFYNGTYWQEMKEEGKDRIKLWISAAASDLLGSRDIQAYYNSFVMRIPHVPEKINMFQPKINAANFQDGTLHWDRVPGERATLTFRKHDRLDYLTSVLPFPYPGDEALANPPPAPEFEAMVSRLWEPELVPLARELTLQIMGAMLMPIYPLIVFFHGAPGSGKSTLIKLFVKIIGYQNCSSVEPAKWQGFNMESMIGKLVNFDTDIDVTRPLQDSELKKMIDRMPRSIRRKFQTDAQAFLPAVHLFAGNDKPSTKENDARALGRRLIFIRTEKYKAPENFDYDFEQRILDQEMVGLIARAVNGLRLLIERDGHYTRLETDQESSKEMVLQHSVVAQFVNEIEEQQVQDNNLILQKDPEARIERSQLWNIFSNWQKDSVPQKSWIGKHAFFKLFLSPEFTVSKRHGTITVHGVGCVNNGHSTM